MRSHPLLIAIVLVLLSSVAYGETPRFHAERQAAYRYLNSLRSRAGLLAFKSNRYLELSAADHARYLAVNGAAGHLQTSGRKGYTGEKPGDRAVFAGYSSLAVTENFSIGQRNTRQSINNLMSAIYHRFAFLDVSKNMMGVGFAENSDGLFFVYNMGSEPLEHLCRYAIYQNDGPFYTDVCGHGDKVSAKTYESRIREVGIQNPEIVIWPVDSAGGVPTAFYEEIPDPLPDYRVSGYPISAQVNPFRIKEVVLKRFKLFDESSGREVSPVRRMTRDLDPNQRFTKFDFALFPLNRLAWNTRYRAEIVLKADGREIRKEWTFRTAQASHPMFVVKGNGENLKLKSNRKYLIHVPAKRHLPYIKQLSWESMSEMKTEVVWRDRNTLQVQLTGEVCETVVFLFNGDRFFNLQIAEQDNLNSEQAYTRGPVTGCVINTIKDLPGFKILARGEVISMKADQDYWVEITGQKKPVTEIRWELQSGMDAIINRLDKKNLFKIRMAGYPGQIGTFFISNSGIFKVVLTQ